MIIHLSFLDWLVVGLYLLFLFYLGIKKSKESSASTKHYILGGRMLTLPAFVASLVSTWYGGILGVGEFSFKYGISNWIVFGAPYYLFAIIFALLFASRIRKSNLSSIPDQLYVTYDKKTGLLGAVLTYFITSPAPYILMFAILLQVVTGCSFGLSLLFASCLTTGYVFVGGFRSVVQTEKLQFALMFSGFILIIVLLIHRYGLFPFLPNNLPRVHLTLTGENSWQYILVWFFIALWTLVAPTFHQFTYAAKDVRTARNGILLSVICWFVFDALTTFSGLYARALLPNLRNASMAFPVLADSFLPSIAKGVFYIAMLATVVSTVDGFTFIASMTIGKDIIAVIMKKSDDVSITNYTRIGILITILLSATSIILFPSIINLWYIIGTIFIPGLLLPLVTSYWQRWKISSHATFIAMLLGWLFSLGSFAWGQLNTINEVAQYPFQIEPMYPGLGVTIVIYIWGNRKKGMKTKYDSTDVQ